MIFAPTLPGVNASAVLFSGVGRQVAGFPGYRLEPLTPRSRRDAKRGTFAFSRSSSAAIASAARVSLTHGIVVAGRAEDGPDETVIGCVLEGRRAASARGALAQFRGHTAEVRLCEARLFFGNLVGRSRCSGPLASLSGSTAARLASKRRGRAPTLHNCDDKTARGRWLVACSGRLCSVAPRVRRSERSEKRGRRGRAPTLHNCDDKTARGWRLVACSRIL
jgi:hypothetical protein